MDISTLRNVTSGAVREALGNQPAQTAAVKTDHSAFDSMLTAAMDNLGTTNAYLSDAENEKLKWALGESSSTHDMTNAMDKASIALNYTVTVRDKLLEAYKEIMQIQI